MTDSRQQSKSPSLPFLEIDIEAKLVLLLIASQDMEERWKLMPKAMHRPEPLLPTAPPLSERKTCTLMTPPTHTTAEPHLILQETPVPSHT